ncbi:MULTISPECIES: DNA mismatch repair endonuclease MutL [Pacificibacter]|uniref:DNA mismatch repair endonuclease MutL n=1 Tax=Pacificibacter TaxID=1042323 RepID=UPI001C0A400D|nr:MULTISPECIES: DNA mismatch repair endonuclease MutL [Pacificibacter]MBU2935973.1 DNA mismatch repair endonuclease MutL [Pacificibacter marinus]MDO6615178.1 DNA mismatch repair endonuclease MutL [Pacificibacter sp. 1_MG-2023]
MNSPDLNIGQSGPESRPVIRQLDEGAINRIAAGEVVERPASAVKELVENAIDAGAHRITVDYADGGKTLIRVTDDGCGMTADDLPLALSRHATSKIDGTDLLNIHTFGFRGEALPSLGAVGRLKITSRAEGHDGVSLSISGGRFDPIKPAALTKGTVVELRDLFFATPARLKFLRTDRAEAKAISDVVKRLAMAEPFVGFVLRDVSGGGEGRVTFRADPQTGDMFDALHGRLATVLGKEFAENALAIDAEREGLHLTGYAALPTYSRGSSVAQFLFVNGRPVQDRLLLGALRAAYFDYLSRDRHPAACLFIDVDPHRVDVNVHPAKSEVRFREPAEARSLIVSGLRNALAAAGHRASTTVAQDTLKAMQPETSFLGRQNHLQADDAAPRIYQMDRRESSGYTMPPRPSADSVQSSYEWQAPERADVPGFAEVAMPSARVEEVARQPAAEKLPLGAARAQVHENYIIAQTETGIVIVDQHAAHERLVYEKLKKLMAENGVASQALLIPEVIELGVNDAQTLLDLADDLAGLGLVIEAFGAGTIAVRETPAILGRVDASAMISDILDELADLGDSHTVQARIEAVLSRVACHGSIRSGRWMRGEEMNALLREMESTPHSGQCNHGRPTYVELKLSDIERLFGRT